MLAGKEGEKERGNTISGGETRGRKKSRRNRVTLWGVEKTIEKQQLTSKIRRGEPLTQDKRAPGRGEETY